MTTLDNSKDIMRFIKTYLYNSTDYKFDDGTTQALNVPYPDSGVYRNFILDYTDAKSVDALDVNIDQLYSEVVDVDAGYPKIERAYEFILEERNPGAEQVNVLITVGINTITIDDGSVHYYLQHLQDKYGFRALAVSIGPNRNSFVELAESPDWYFAATDANGQWVAEQISRIICPTPTTYRRTTVTRGRVTPTVTPGSTTYTPSCPTPYRGKVAIAFELNSVQTELQKVVAFIRNFLFPLPIFKYHDGTSRVISVPYGGSFFYKNILEYNYTAGYYSVPILQANIDTLNKEAVSTTNATIYSAFQYLDAERDTYQSRAALIVVGVHDDYVNDESTQFTREILRVDQDYQLLAVSMGTGDLGSLANKRDWAFRVSDGNEQEIANKIGQVLCYLNW